MNNDVPDELLFSAAFPLPFRVLCLAGLGILGWATNLHGLAALGLDAAAALDISRVLGRYASVPLLTRGLQKSPPPLYSPLYQLFGGYAVWTTVTWLFYRWGTHEDIYRVDTFKFIPALASLFVLTILVSPWNVCKRPERDRFLYAINRCLLPPANQRIFFSDVVFADVFTSYAKVLGDMWLSLVMLLPGGSLLSQPAQEGLSRWILPTLMSVPYAVRLRQCLVEYRLATENKNRPLFNALKYATSFPVIFLSAAQRIVVSDLVAAKGDSAAREAWHGEHQLFRLWLLAVLVNSMYSFWWDVTYDWGFDLLLPNSPYNPTRANLPLKTLVLPSLHSRSSSLVGSPQTAEDAVKDALLESGHPPQRRYSSFEVRSYPWGLRPTLLFPLAVYPFAILADFVLRLTWSLKLSSHLHSYAEGEVAIFWIELAEIVRRWMWVFIRVEWEVVKSTREPSPRSALNGEPRYMEPDEEYEMVRSDRSSSFSEVG